MSGPHDRSAFSEALERLEDDRDASFANGLEIEARQPRMCLENYGKLGPRILELGNYAISGWMIMMKHPKVSLLSDKAVCLGMGNSIS